MSFGERLRDARLAAKKSGEALGAVAGVSKQLVSHWENGRHFPNVPQLEAICTALTVSADALIYGKGEVSQEALRVARAWQALTPNGRSKFQRLWNVLFEESPDETEGIQRIGSSGAAKRKEPAKWSDSSKKKSPKQSGEP